jgi:hypothetical protein
LHEPEEIIIGFNHHNVLLVLKGIAISLKATIELGELRISIKGFCIE